MSDAAPEPSAETPDSIPAKPPPRKARRVLARIGIASTAIIILGLAVIGTEPYWRPYVRPLLAWGPAETTTNDAQAALAARFDALERRVAALQSLDQRVGALEQRPAPDARASIAPLEDRVQQLSARLDQVEARLAQLVKDQAARGDSAQRVLIVALADLGNAVSSSRPFAAQLASVEALGWNRPDWASRLRALEDAAKTGLPGTAVLAQHFSDEVAPAILRAEATSPGQSGIGQAILAKLRALVVIRRTDGAGGTPAQEAVATAEAALAKGDLAGAVAALSDLSGPAQAAAEPWLKQAKQRLQAEQTVVRLTQEVSADLAAGAGGG
jgi:hypothetical protein